MAEDAYPLDPGCRIKHQFRTTNWLAGVMVSVLQQYFGCSDRITMEQDTLLWHTDGPTTEVQIDVVDNLNYGDSHKHPKILVDVETQEFPHDVLQDQMGYLPNGTIEYFNRDQSAFLIECWGLKKLEAAAIADEVRYFIQAYRHIIANKYGFEKLRVKTLLKPVKYKQYDDYWIARVVVIFETSETWGTTKESLEVSDFTLKLNAI